VKNCKPVFLAALIFLGNQDTSGQKKDTVLLGSREPFQAIKISPLHLINLYPAVLVGYERQISKHQSLQGDIGPVFSDGNNNPEFLNKRGMKLKVEYRYYLNRYDFRRAGSYLSAEAYFNSVDFDRETTQTECFDLNCQSTFRRTFLYKVSYREPGLALKYGFMMNVNRFIFDFSAGHSLRFIDYIKPAFVDPQNTFDWSLFHDETKRTEFGIQLYARLGYQIGGVGRK
jgi:hypothetical protein